VKQPATLTPIEATLVQVLVSAITKELKKENGPCSRAVSEPTTLGVVPTYGVGHAVSRVGGSDSPRRPPVAEGGALRVNERRVSRRALAVERINPPG
jgi:hypothetical protein